MAIAAGALLVGGLGIYQASADDRVRFQAQTNWAVEIDGVKLDWGQEFRDTVRLDRNGELEYITQGALGQRLFHDLNCGPALENAEVRATVGTDGMVTIRCAFN
jgi:hypothetical protein